MNIYNWKILSVTNQGDLITDAHYHLSATDGVNTVETQGKHNFNGTEIKVPLSELREQIIINWIVDETTENEVCSIKDNLDKQLLKLQEQKTSGLPWMANTYKPNI
jgi:hypothetical protein